MIFVVDDDKVMAKCIAKACGAGLQTVKIFNDAISAMNELDAELPEIIFLDVLLNGPDGFTFLNEMVSYTDTAKIPVVIVTSLDFGGRDLSAYGVVGVLDKSKMVPEDIRRYVEKYARH